MSPIRKGQDWGARGALPNNGIIVRSDAEARSVLEEARRAQRELPTLGLLGGDLARTLGGQGDEGRLHSGSAMTFSVDLGEALIDGRHHLFVAHVVARSRSWRRVFAACNAQHIGRWDVAPKSHPNDGLLDCYDCRVTFGEMWKISRRLPLGSHLPHPAIKETRVRAAQIEFERPLRIWIDGSSETAARSLSVRVEADALTVVV